jgi:hypothetical protein
VKETTPLGVLVKVAMRPSYLSFLSLIDPKSKSIPVEYLALLSDLGKIAEEELCHTHMVKTLLATLTDHESKTLTLKPTLQSLDQEVDLSNQTKSPISVMLVKSLNPLFPSYEISSRIRNGLKPIDTLGRLGPTSDTFLIILPECPFQEAKEVGSTIRGFLVSTPLVTKEWNLWASVRIGICSWTSGKHQNPEKLISCASQALLGDSDKIVIVEV